MQSQIGIYALVIDDDPEQYELTKTILALDGYKVLTADNAREGLKLYECHQPFIIISDFSMPDMDGADLVERLKKDYVSAIPVVLVSAHTPDYIRQRLPRGYQPAAIFAKPVDFDQLLHTVQHYYQHYQQSHQQESYAA